MPSLIATLGANITPFVQKLDEAKGHASSHGDFISSALGHGLTEKLGEFVSIGAVEETFRRTFEWAEKLSNLSIRTGLGTTELQKLEGIAAKTGTSVESLAGFYERLGKAMATAHKEGAGGETAGAISRRGVSSETLESGDMVAAMREVAEHFQRFGEITPQVEADLSKIFKNAREVIPALKAMTEEEGSFNKSVAVGPDKMAAMATIMETLKDSWRVVSGFAKNTVGSIAGGAVELTRLVKWASLAAVGSFMGKKPSDLYDLMDAEEEARKKREEELHGQKPGDPGYAKDKADKKADEAAAKQEAQDKKEIASIHAKTEEEERRGKKAAMSHAERVKALQEEVDLLETHMRLGKSMVETDAMFAEQGLELAKRKTELAEEKRRKDKDDIKRVKDESPFKPHDMEVNALQKSGFFIGSFAAAPELAALDLQKKSENHLAAIRKGIERLNMDSGAPDDDVQF